jgi:DeoR/GlpR family transcriptional regulator of sugar metabolism
LCQRVYGGALPASPAVGDYAARTTISVTSKESVATRAAGLVRPGSTVILDGGTTALAVTKALAGLTTGDADEAAMKRIPASRAADTYVLASAEKIGAASRFTVLPLDEVAGIITDSAGSDPTVRRLGERGIPILGPGDAEGLD